VGQLKYVMHNIFNGLFWYVLPCCLVFVNDIMAYVAGVTCGRKFIQRPFILVSPNKTWEGFIGGGIFTIIAAWHLAGFLAQFSWMNCPVNEFRLAPDALTCEPHPIFMPAQAKIPSQIFELFPAPIVKAFFPIVEICTNSTNSVLLRCVSGANDLLHHHFELYMTNYYPVQMHALWLGLFASLVAPFGGFLASAIKRAYGIKDFDSLIPGHGGVMDRMDCQFLMALYTWVHFNSFVKFSNVSVPKLVYLYSMLSENEQGEFLQVIRNVEPSTSYT
jgi:phosphatidate cytidylyltransferase